MRGVLLIALALWACDDGAASRGDPPDPPDHGLIPLDGGPDAAPDSQPDPDGRLAPDAASEPDGGPSPDHDAAPLDCPAHQAPPPAPGTLGDTHLVAEIALGGPAGDDALRPVDLDGDGAPEWLIARGGRLDAHDLDGAGRWRTPVLDIDRVVGVADLDGDGRLEAVAAARRAVHVVDALTGRLRWTSPERPFGDDRAPSTIQRVDLVDLDGDALPELYLTDGGCGDEGTGRGATWRFAGPVFGEPLATIDGPRTNGRCTRWQSFADLDGDGRPALLVTDADGLSAFDPLTGRRRLCGTLDAPPNGPLPHLAVADQRAVFLPDAVALVAPDGAGDDACPDGRLVATHRAPLAVHADGSGVIDDPPRLITSAVTDGRWRIHALDLDGPARPIIDDARLLAVLPDPPLALAAVAEPAAPARFGAVQAYDLTTDPPSPLWPLPIPRAALVRASADTFAPPLVLPGADGPEFLLLRTALIDGAPTGLADRLERIDLTGALLAAHPLAGDPGALRAVGDHLAAALPDGGLVLFDPALDPIHPPLPAPVGAAELAHDGALYARTGAGTIARLDLADARARWQLALGVPGRGAPSLTALGDGALVRDARAGDAAWAVLDPDGHLRWRHRLDPALYRPVGEAVAARADGRVTAIARADLALRPADLPDRDPTCDVEHLDPDAAAPAEQCPGFDVRPRVLHGLDPVDGRCRWRRVLRPSSPCGGPSNQALSVADPDGDGRDALYLTETDAIRQLDPATGALVATHRLVPHDAALNGGGWLRARDGVLVRVGGNAPIEAYDPDLTPRWAAQNPPGLRLQGWIGRDARLHAGAAWLAPARGYPLVRYALADGASDRQIGLADGRATADAPLAPDYGDVRGLTPVGDLDGAPGLLAVTDDGHLYALDADGALRWARAHPARVGAPVVAPAEPDALPSIALPAADGRVLVYGPPGPTPPPAAWDLPCPPNPGCDPADDIDRTEDGDRLCANWIPIDGASRYDARVLGPGGAVVRDWRPTERPARIDELALTPGAHYTVEIRAVVRLDDRDRISRPRATDGVEYINDAPPTVALAAHPRALGYDARPVRLVIAALDDDRLAGWRLDLRDAADQTTHRLGGGPLAAAAFEAEIPWDLTDRDKRLLPPGRHRVVAEVTDRAGHTARAEATVTICAADCP